MFKRPVQDFISHTQAAVAYHCDELEEGDIFSVNGEYHKIKTQEECACEKCGHINPCDFCVHISEDEIPKDNNNGKES